MLLIFSANIDNTHWLPWWPRWCQLRSRATRHKRPTKSQNSKTMDCLRCLWAYPATCSMAVAELFSVRISGSGGPIAVEFLSPCLGGGLLLELTSKQDLAGSTYPSCLPPLAADKLPFRVMQTVQAESLGMSVALGGPWANTCTSAFPSCHLLQHKFQRLDAQSHSAVSYTHLTLPTNREV